jgi:hypothetical protein
VDALLGVQHQRLVFLHFWRDKSLGIDQRLLADVVFGSPVCCAARDLNIVAEDLVVPDFERLDARLLAFDHFQVGDPVAGVFRCLDDRVQFL